MEPALLSGPMPARQSALTFMRPVVAVSGFPNEKTRHRSLCSGCHRADDLGLLPGHLRRANDAMQGEIFRIIYYHVPSFAVAFVFFAVSLGGSIGYLRISAQFSESGAESPMPWALAGAEVGVVFCTVGLTTGPIWGRRAWGIWWTWDARLTTTLVLWLIYVSYLLLRRFAAGPQMQTLAAVLGIFGALDVPIVYMANRWWRTQHPAPVFGGGPGSGHGPDDGGRAAVEYAGMVSHGA